MKKRYVYCYIIMYNYVLLCIYYERKYKGFL
jgi:hypothetical protein